MLQSGVSEVIYFVEKRLNNSQVEYIASRKLLSMAGVRVSLLETVYFSFPPLIVFFCCDLTDTQPRGGALVVLEGLWGKLLGFHMRYPPQPYISTPLKWSMMQMLIFYFVFIESQAMDLAIPIYHVDWIFFFPSSLYCRSENIGRKRNKFWSILRRPSCSFILHLLINIRNLFGVPVFR